MSTDSILDTTICRTAKFIDGLLKEQKIESTLFNEGHFDHPTDYEYAACLEEREYQQVTEMFVDCAKLLEKYTINKQSDRIVSYGKMKTENETEVPNELVDILYQHDIYELPLNKYSRLILDRWRDFVANAQHYQKVTVLECCFLQNPITFLLAKHNVDKPEIIGYLKTIAQIIEPLKPVLIYLHQDDCQRTIENVKKRADSWFSHVANYYTQQDYGKAYHLSNDMAGIVHFLEARKAVEFETINQIPMQSLVINNTAWDWPNIRKEIKEFLLERG